MVEKIIDKVIERIINMINPINICRQIQIRVLPAKFNLGISFKYYQDDELLRSYHKEIIERLNELIDKNNLSKYVKINDFSDIKTFKNKEHAESYRNSKKIDLLVWGRLSSSKLQKNGESIVKPILNFTYGHPNDLNNNIGKALVNELSRVLATKEFVNEIIESDSYNKIENLNLSIFEVSMYIIGLSMKLFGKIDSAMKLFESLMSNINDRNNYFSRGVIFHLSNIYELKLLSFTWIDKGFEEALEISNKYLKLDPNNIETIAAKAYSLFKLGRKIEAYENIRFLKQINPNSHITHIDLAFLYVVEGKYTQAFNEYETIENVKPEKLRINSIQVIEFLDRQVDLNPEEFGYLFGSAFLNFHFGDKVRAVEIFKRFIKIANKRTYKKMYNYADRCI